MVKWLRIDQISKRTGIPESTIKNYVKTYDDYFDYEDNINNENSDNHNGVLYHPEACEKVLRIYELSQQDYSEEKIKQALNNEFNNSIDLVEADDGLNNREKVLSQNMKIFTEAFEKIVQQRQEINSLRDRIDKLENEQKDVNQKFDVEITQLKRGKSKREDNKILGFSPGELLIIPLIVAASIVIAITVLEYF
ncbi:MerR family transcriptional regulator [Natranaerofaba carboxydovora]|uniref:MerR family transcriptional regulator n=1 Tax=Natranaerofaba carboxydovora TaxID=2742683 RepID=UPI001F12A4F9|nr:MerR family transcriptional regulator [Natranaerofaba carboxydovora]UMZ73502.1 hypothetical protein ACONDI_01056 [Natranaerofaba carboxydovora]